MKLIDEVCKLSADNKDSHYTLIVQKIVDGIKKKAIKGKTHYNFREMKKWQKLSKKDRKKIKKYFENEGFFVNDLSCNYDEDDWDGKERTKATGKQGHTTTQCTAHTALLGKGNK